MQFLSAAITHSSGNLTFFKFSCITLNLSWYNGFNNIIHLKQHFHNGVENRGQCPEKARGMALKIVMMLLCTLTMFFALSFTPVFDDHALENPLFHNELNKLVRAKSSLFGPDFCRETLAELVKPPFMQAYARIFAMTADKAPKSHTTPACASLALLFLAADQRTLEAEKAAALVLFFRTYHRAIGDYRFFIEVCARLRQHLPKSMYYRLERDEINPAVWNLVSKAISSQTHSETEIQEQISELRRHFPQAFPDGNISVSELTETPEKPMPLPPERPKEEYES